MNEILEDRIEKAKKLIKNSDCVLIGAGAGLSTAAGIEYAGEAFNKEFKEYIDKYSFTDLYSSSFYDFDTKEEYWAYWAKHIYFANTGREGTKLYKEIYDLVKNKEYFVITTNVDDQFYKTGFDKEKIFRVQGSYRYIQCSKACHNKLYDAKDLVEKMLKNTDKDLKIKSDLVPKCPVCGENMEPNLRKDGYFIEDYLWHEQAEKYGEFLENNRDKKVVLLEFGVGFNTPTIIRIPFEQMIEKNENWNLVRFNKDNISTFFDINDKTVGFTEDIGNVIEELK